MGNDKVVLGIDAPKEIKIMREELLETIQANQAATQTHGADDLNKIASFIKRNKND
jgi:carbon storage regulator CsrA